MNPQYEAAMVAPIKCRGAACQQGRCQSPMKCSGMTREADEAIAKFRLHRQAMPITFAGPEPEDETDFPGWSVAPWFIAALVAGVAVVVGFGGTAIYYVMRALL